MEWYYYLVIVLVLLIIIGIIISFVLCHKHAEQNLKHKVWKKLYKLANNSDYYLLNQVNIETEFKSNIHIDHLLIGDKFVYVISSRYYEDNLYGKTYYDSKFNINTTDGTLIRSVTNPIIKNEKRSTILAKYLGCEKKYPMFVSIVVTNNVDVNVAEQNIADYSYIIKCKDLSKTIKSIEKESNLTPIDDQSLQQVVNRLHTISVSLNKKEAEKENQ